MAIAGGIPNAAKRVDIQGRVPAQTSRRILRALRDEGLLRELHPASGRRATVLAFPELLNIAEGEDAF